MPKRLPFSGFTILGDWFIEVIEWTLQKEILIVPIKRQEIKEYNV